MKIRIGNEERSERSDRRGGVPPPDHGTMPKLCGQVYSTAAANPVHCNVTIQRPWNFIGDVNCNVFLIHTYGVLYTPYRCIIFFLDLAKSFFRLGLNKECSELEYFGQIASFERRLRGAAPTPLSRPSSFRTST